jgi:hypothetical protein
MTTLLGVIVHPNITLAQVFYILAAFVAVLWLFGLVAKRPEPYWGAGVALCLLLVALGLLFSY